MRVRGNGGRELCDGSADVAGIERAACEQFGADARERLGVVDGPAASFERSRSLGRPTRTSRPPVRRKVVAWRDQAS
jgi:hypothetical protein